VNAPRERRPPPSIVPRKFLGSCSRRQLGHVRVAIRFRLGYNATAGRERLEFMFVPIVLLTGERVPMEKSARTPTGCQGWPVRASPWRPQLWFAVGLRASF